MICNASDYNVTIEFLCSYDQPPMTNQRFWLVTVFGSSISFFSIINNILLFYLFFSRKQNRGNHNVYLLLLSFFDIFVSAAYIFLMSVNVLSDYLISPSLVTIWYSYMVPMITISHIAMTSSTNLIVCATFERYCVTLSTQQLAFAQRHRKMIASLAILLGVLSKGTMYFEFKLCVFEECAGLMTYTQMEYAAFAAQNTQYHFIIKFWYRNFFTVFAPFLILVYLNIRIVKALTVHTKMTVCQLAGNAILEQAKRKWIENPHLDPVRRKATARAATRTMVCVCCCYMISNIINVLVTIWEHVDKSSLLTYMDLYAISVDLVSLLTTLACACRLPIYLACQAPLRKEFFDMMANMCSCWRKKKHQMFEDSECLMNCSTTNTSRATVETSVDGKDTVTYKRMSRVSLPKIERRISMMNNEDIRLPITEPPSEHLRSVILTSAYETLL